MMSSMMAMSIPSSVRCMRFPSNETRSSSTKRNLGTNRQRNLQTSNEFFILCNALSFDSNMNKMQYSTLSLPYREYREIARMDSKERVGMRRKCSRSPEEKEMDVGRKIEKEEYKILQERYRELEGKYRDMFETVKQRNAEHEKLKTEIKIYKKNHERDI